MPRSEKVTPPARARLDVDERRAQLLGVGLAMFSERAYDDVSIDDIATAAGVSKGLLYHYFPTKRDLYVAALAEAATRLREETITRTEGSPEERLVAGLSTYLAFVERHGKAYVALMRGGIGSDPEVAAIIEGTRRAFGARILEDLPPDDRKKPLLAMALRGWIGFVEVASIDWAGQRTVHREQLVELLVGVLLDVMTRAADVASKPRRSPRAARSKNRAREGTG